MKKTIVSILAVLVVLGAGWYLFSNYLVSKLDGTGGVQAPAEFARYESRDELHMSFLYPNKYEPVLHTEGNAERHWHTLVLLPDNYVPPQGGEGPATITIQHIPNPEGLTLEAWVLGDARSNWKLAAQDGGLGSTTVGNQPALSYRYSGLYETQAVAVARGNDIFLFSASWLDEAGEASIRAEFEQLLSSVDFL